MAAIQQIINQIKKWSQYYSASTEKSGSTEKLNANLVEKLHPARIDQITSPLILPAPAAQKTTQSMPMDEKQMLQHLIDLNRILEPDILPTSKTAIYDPAGDDAMSNTAQIYSFKSASDNGKLNRYGEIFKAIKLEVTHSQTLAETAHYISEYTQKLTLFESARAIQSLQSILDQTRQVPGLGTSPQGALSLIWTYIHQQPQSESKTATQARLINMLIETFHTDEMNAKGCVQQIIEVVNHNQSDLQHLFKA